MHFEHSNVHYWLVFIITVLHPYRPEEHVSAHNSTQLNTTHEHNSIGTRYEIPNEIHFVLSSLDKI